MDPVLIGNPTGLPDQGPIHTMNYATFLAISPKDMQELFRAYPVIVVSGRPTRLKCDVESLEEWGGIDDLRIMHGKVIIVVSGPHLMISRQFSV